MDKLLKPVMHGQCDARLTVNFPAIGHHVTMESGAMAELPI